MTRFISARWFFIGQRLWSDLAEALADLSRYLAVVHVILLEVSCTRYFFLSRREVLDCVIQLQNFQNQFLPNALRRFFCKVSAPSERGSYLEQIIDRFSERFVSCNPHLGLHKGE